MGVSSDAKVLEEGIVEARFYKVCYELPYVANMFEARQLLDAMFTFAQ